MISINELLISINELLISINELLISIKMDAVSNLLISINELLISIISFNDINKYGLNVKTAAHTYDSWWKDKNADDGSDRGMVVSNARLDVMEEAKKVDMHVSSAYCSDRTFALQSCVYTEASLMPLPHRAPP